MVIVLVAGILIGAVLSLRLNVVVLLPVTCAALMIAAIGGAARGDSVWYLVSTMVLVVIALRRPSVVSQFTYSNTATRL